MYDCLKNTNSQHWIKVREEILALFDSNQLFGMERELLCQLLEEIIQEKASKEVVQLDMFGRIDPGDRKPLNALL